MITPSDLQKGDTIAFASPARSISAEQIQFAVSFFEAAGYCLRIDNEVFAVENQFGGSDALRATHFNRLLADTSVKAIISSRGGYGSMRMAEMLDLSLLAKNPKWIAGYSDITVLLSLINHETGIECIHGPMLNDMGTADKSSCEMLIRVFGGEAPQYHFAGHPMNRAGKASGKLVGGNLSMLYSLAAAKMLPPTDGAVLFLEDVDEYLYHIDRMLLSLRKAGYFSNLAGVIVGAFSAMHDNSIAFGRNVEEMIREHTNTSNCPVAFGFPAGHQPQNLSLILGRETAIEAKNNGISALTQLSI